MTATGAGATQTYDANGNLIQKVEGGVTWTYVWNAENQLTRVLNGGSEVARYKYDPLGRRVERVAGGTTSLWAYEGGDLLRETIGASSTKYIHGPGIDEPLARDIAGTLTYLHPDGLGSITTTTSAAGAVVTSDSYDAFGTLSGGASGYAYTGREWDPDAGLYYYRARSYDPQVGRFISEDPIGFDGGNNFYAYVANNPVVLIDPYGLFPRNPRLSDMRAYLADPVAGEAKRQCYYKAEDMVRRVFGSDEDGTRGNAFKHCYWSCCISREVGPQRAEQQTTAHEQIPNNPGRDMYMDMSNNYQGASRASAFPEKGCKLICLEAPASCYK